MYGQYKYGEYEYGEESRFITPDTDKYQVALIPYLTSNYQNGNNIKKLMKIIESELGELKYFSIDLGKQASIDKSTWGIRLYEEELGIDYNPLMTYEERREIIKAKLRGRGTTTKEMIINTAESFSGGEVDVIEYPEEDYFIVKFIGVKGIPKNMKAFIEMLETIKPAHLAYEFRYTYTTCQMLIDWNITCGDALLMTCNELKTYDRE